jgi:hypothetical protein
MPKINFHEVPDVEDYAPLPDGTYLCRLSDVKLRETQNGDEMWNLNFIVTSGPCEGRHIFDNLVFSKAALKRVKLVCSRMGLETSNEVDVTPELIIGQTCGITVRTEDYVEDNGQTKQRNVVPFAGYLSAEDASASAGGGAEGKDSQGDIPF